MDSFSEEWFARGDTGGGALSLSIFSVSPDCGWRPGSRPLLPVPRLPGGCLPGVVSAQVLGNPCANASPDSASIAEDREWVAGWSSEFFLASGLPSSSSGFPVGDLKDRVPLPWPWSSRPLRFEGWRAVWPS